jgi:hypothetical protein
MSRSLTFFLGARNSGVGVFKTVANSTNGQYFEANKASANLSSVSIFTNVFYDLMFDHLYFAVNGISQAVNQYGVTLQSVVDRSWVDPKSLNYANFTKMRGKYFSTSQLGASFYYGRARFNDGGVFTQPNSVYQPNLDNYVRTAQSLPEVVATVEDRTATILRPIYWSQNGSTVPPRLTPITCTALPIIANF